MSEKEIKVHDKRMFTPDGALREEYRFLDEKATAAAGAPPEPAPVEPPPPPPPPHAPESDPRRRGASPPPPLEPERESGPRLELPGTPPGLGPTFYDLAAMIAEPVAIYLGDVELPDGQTAENLEMARLYIDLLEVLRQKTAGNLTVQENAFLEDLLYRLRVRYVQKRG
ncbi:MAG TPA: DUF1844 domain-containing protein [Thermoanaerobaculia bacterium]